MGESQLRCVQRLSAKAELFQYLVVGFSRPSIDGITNERMAERCHVHPDLVGATGFQPAFDQGGIPKRAPPFPMGDRAFAAAILDDRDLLAVGRRAGKRCINLALIGLRNTRNDRQIAAVDAVCRELLRQALVSDVGLGDHQ